MTETVLLELGGLLVILAVVAHIASRFSLSPIPLYLAAGLAFGEGGPFPLLTTVEFIEVAAEIGVVLLLFTLGLEYSAHELLDKLRVTVPTGIVDVGLNFTPGFVAGLVLGWGPLVGFLLGGVTYISSSGIAADLIRSMGWARSPEATKVIGVLVVEDLIMAGYLAIVTVAVIGGAASDVALAVLVAASAVAFALWFGLRFGERFSSWMFSHRGEKLILGLVGFSLLAAGVAEEFRVGAAVGAFLAGLMLSGTASHEARDLLDPLRGFFAAAFFVLFGLQLDPGELPDVLTAAIVLAVITTATKLATGWLGGARVGSDLQGKLRVGTLLVARGEFSIIIAELGLAAGLRPELGSLAVAYVFLLAAAGPVLVRLTDPLARRLAGSG